MAAAVAAAAAVRPALATSGGRTDHLCSGSTHRPRTPACERAPRIAAASSSVRVSDAKGPKSITTTGGDRVPCSALLDEGVEERSSQTRKCDVIERGPNGATRCLCFFRFSFSLPFLLL